MERSASLRLWMGTFGQSGGCELQIPQLLEPSQVAEAVGQFNTSPEATNLLLHKNIYMILFVAVA